LTERLFSNGGIVGDNIKPVPSPSLEPKQGNTLAVFVAGGKYDELKAVLDKLGEGAEKERLQELRDMPFGTYGQFYDRYGVQWIFKGDGNEKIDLQSRDSIP
jgi:uncharacterized glyoxalase superfamily protein PhnB